MEGGGEGEKGGQRLLGEGLERSGVCSVHEETGQGVRLRNSLQRMSHSHVDHHVLPPPPSVCSLLLCCLSVPSIAFCLHEQCVLSVSLRFNPTQSLTRVCPDPGWTRQRGKSPVSLETCRLLHITCLGREITAVVEMFVP